MPMSWLRPDAPVISSATTTLRLLDVRAMPHILPRPCSWVQAERRHLRLLRTEAELGKLLTFSCLEAESKVDNVIVSNCFREKSE